MTETILLAQKIELDCNNRERTYFARACGCARKAYNWALDHWQEEYRLYREAKKSDPNQTQLECPNQFKLRRELNAIKAKEFPYMLEVTKCAPQSAIIDLGKAFENFFRDPKRFHYPKFRKKYVDDQFRISNDQFQIDASRIRIPKLGWVRMRETLRFKDAKVLSATISRKADRWFVSIQCELPNVEHLKKADNQGVCGVDLGITTLATLSNGLTFEGPKAYEKNLKKLRRLQRSLARRKIGSANRTKKLLEIQKFYVRMTNIRHDCLHKLTSYLTSHFETIVIEDLNVKGMMKNRRLSRRIADMGFHEFRRQLEYKARLRGNEVIVADRFYPSSKTCRFCGIKNEGLTLGERHWTCPHCEAVIENRDLNAAINLKNLAASCAVSAGGESASGRRNNLSVKSGSKSSDGVYPSEKEAGRKHQMSRSD